MNKKVYVVVSNVANRVNVEGVFSNYEYAEKFSELENSKIEEFRKQDEGFNIKTFKIDSRKVPDNQCYKKYWDYSVIINENIQEYGTIKFAGTDRELVHINKSQDVEIFDGEFIYCRSYVSKQEAENICKEQWQIYEQKQVLNKGYNNGFKRD